MIRHPKHGWEMPDCYRAMPSARAAAASRWSLLHVSSIAGIAIATFAASWFLAALVSGAGQL